MKHIMTIAIALCMIAAPVSAQKKSKNAKKVAEPVVDYSLYTDNPICKVTIVDSLVVPVHEVLRKIQLPTHMGHFFSSPDIGGQMVFENEFGDLRMFSVADENGHHQIYTQTLLGNNWSNPEKVEINGAFTDIINPFPKSDGQTLFFAARSEDDNEGHSFSLYTTTYDSETCSYLTPTRLPFPFVSTANDLYYIEDEQDGIAWLVTTRNQPDGKACIYTMANKQPWEYYDSEEYEPAKLKSLALITQISDTWTSFDQRNNIIKQFKTTLDEYNEPVTTVVNDEPLVRRTMSEKIDNLKRKIEEYRRVYNNTPAENRNPLEEAIREAEAQLTQYYKSMRQL